MLYPLYTLNGSKIWYSTFGVGKQMRSKIYLHINSRFRIIPTHIFNTAVKILRDNNMEPYNFHTLCYDFKKPDILRFDECPGFCSEREPIVGNMVYVNTSNSTICTKYNPQIYHHKWLFVPENFEGFSTLEAYNWSKQWLAKISSPSGYIHKWNKELTDNGLPIDCISNHIKED